MLCHEPDRYEWGCIFVPFTCFSCVFPSDKGTAIMPFYEAKRCRPPWQRLNFIGGSVVGIMELHCLETERSNNLPPCWGDGIFIHRYLHLIMESRTRERGGLRCPPPQRHTSRTSEGCVINNQQDRWQHRLHLEVATPSAPWRTHIKELCDIQATQWGVLHPDKCTKAPFSCPVPKQQWLLQKKVWQGREDPPFFPPKSHFQYRLLKHRTLGSFQRKQRQRKELYRGFWYTI